MEPSHGHHDILEYKYEFKIGWPEDTPTLQLSIASTGECGDGNGKKQSFRA